LGDAINAFKARQTQQQQQQQQQQQGGDEEMGDQEWQQPPQQQHSQGVKSERQKSRRKWSEVEVALLARGREMLGE
jgi:Sec-independent protein translocase protein TatA